jgi:protein involved in polysaccharide export with SLBB domain
MEEATEVNLTLDNGGAINLPVSNKLLVLRGKTLSDAESDVRAEMGRAVRGAQVTLSLRQVRMITVTILGESFAAGTYQMPNTVTLFNAIYATGGPSDSGTLRRVQLRRSQGDVRNFDLYKFLISGDTTGDIPLQNGDLIFFSPATKMVSVTGEVVRPAMYELLENETLSDLIRFAEGLRPSAVAQRISVVSTNPGIARQLIDVDVTGIDAEGRSLQLNSGDTVTVFSIRDELVNAVLLEGAVDQPSRYEVTPGMTIADLIDRARGTLVDAYMPRADLFRKNPDGTSSLIPVNLASAMKRQPGENIEIRPGDRLVIYRESDVRFIGGRRVSIEGAVQFPKTVERPDGMRVRDLLIQGGGPLPDANLDVAFLRRRNVDGSNGPLIRINIRKAMAGDASENVILENDDELLVFRLQDTVARPEQTIRIEGAVTRPGTYNRFEGMRLSDLIMLAGGLRPDAFADQVFIRRTLPSGLPGPLLKVNAGAAVQMVEAENILLEDQDDVLVPTVREAQYVPPLTVSITGGVQRPGTYAWAQGMTIRDLFQLAGGTLPNADDTVEYARAVAPNTEPVRQLSYSRIMGSNEDNVPLEPGDVVTIQIRNDIRIEVATVTIIGAVLRPGPYVVAQGERLSSVIARAGGLLAEAYPEGAAFARDERFLVVTPQARQLPAISETFRQMSEQEYLRMRARADIEARAILAASGMPESSGNSPLVGDAIGGAVAATRAAQAAAAPNLSVDLVSPARPLRAEDLTPAGNLNINLINALRNPGGQDDVILYPGDIISVPGKPTAVSVIGAVVQPSSIFFEPGRPIDYYVQLSGGYLSDAATSEILIIRMNGRVVRYRRGVRIEVGDVIFIPSRVQAERISANRNRLDEAIKQVTNVGLVLAILRSITR